MPLYVMTEKCRKDAQIRTDSTMQYNLGCMMMCLGISELNKKSLPDFHARLEFWQRLSEFMTPESTEHYWQAAQDSIGVRINSKPETNAGWIKRIAFHKFSDIVYRQKNDSPVDEQKKQLEDLIESLPED